MEIDEQVFTIILRTERWSPWTNTHFVSRKRIYLSIYLISQKYGNINMTYIKRFNPRCSCETYYVLVAKQLRDLSTRSFSFSIVPSPPFSCKTLNYYASFGSRSTIFYCRFSFLVSSAVVQRCSRRNWE